jgi:predicted kinase
VKKVVLMVGAPGSGKSTRVKAQISSIGDGDYSVVSADHYFEDSDGVYTFDRSKLHHAHQTCQSRFVAGLVAGKELVIVDNTNTTAKERKFYIEMARQHGYKIEIDAVECDAETCYKRNVHGVPLEAIERMIARIDVPYGLSEVV